MLVFTAARVLAVLQCGHQTDAKTLVAISVMLVPHETKRIIELQAID